MLLEEDPATLIHHTIQNFNIAPDKAAIARVQDSLSTLQQARDLQRREADAALRKLSRQLSVLSARYAADTSSKPTNTTTSSSRPKHQGGATQQQPDAPESLPQLDAAKFRTAKAAADLEVENERLAGRLADLDAQLRELELQGVDGGDGAGRDVVEDEVLLKLKVYRSLGIDVERDAGAAPGGDGPGDFARVVVRNDRKGDVHVVNLDKKFSRFFYANYFWQTL